MLLVNQLRFKAVVVFVILALAMLVVMMSAGTVQAFDNEPPMPPSESIIELIKRDLAKHLNVTPKDITVKSVMPVVWNDSSLGLPQPGQFYLMVITPGYIILLEHGGVGYKYHTDTRRSFKRAWEGWMFSKPRPPIDDPIILPPWPGLPIIK